LNNLKESLSLILEDNYGKVYNIKKEEVNSITSAFAVMNISQINYGKFRHLNQNTEENQEQTTEEESTLESVSMKLEEIVEELREMLEKK
jgi:predicted transcriptional regulator